MQWALIRGHTISKICPEIGQPGDGHLLEYGQLLKQIWYATFKKLEGNGCHISSVMSTLQSLMTPDPVHKFTE